ncbi:MULTISPECIES: hypothetical protein [Bhargavaea]|uniref:Uncharacterized protein n=1 Tax=Bhargavaea changchunensis TaxID=2134037 RepID=A0ABW2NE09_9BACL|nr:hypothetical protein [Bhargavaea sp. CC-171006]
MIAVVQFLMLLAILVLAALLLIWLGAPFWLTVLVLAALYMTLTTVPTLMLSYKSKNLRAIDRFLLRNSRKPIYKYAYSVAHGTDEEIRASLREIMNRYKQPDIRHVYGALLAVTEKDGDGVLSHAEKIGSEPMQSYYDAYGHALNGDYDQSEEALTRIPEGYAWMKHAIRAVMASRKGDRDAFRKEADAAKADAGGIQYYLLHHNFRKMEESAAH